MIAAARAAALAVVALGATTAATVSPALAQQQTVEALPALQWVAASNGAVPRQALAGGAEAGRMIYICRAELDDDAGTRRVGTLRAGSGCEVPVGAEGTAARPRYEVLTGAPWMIAWRQAGDTIREDLVVGGAWQGQAAPLCQIEHAGGIHSGMLVGDRCMVAVEGKTLTADSFRYGAANTNGAFTMRWASQGWVPQGALTASGDATGAVICMARADGAWWPGVLEGDTCTTAGPSGAALTRAATYQTVVGDPDRVAWTRFPDGRQPAFVPDNAVAIGGQGPRGEAIRICRAQGGARMLPGYVSAEGRCIIANSRGEVARVADYDVLLYRQGAPQTAGR